MYSSSKSAVLLGLAEINVDRLILLLLMFFSQDNRMLGMGSGQPNRLESLRIAMKKAGDEVKGAALASDAFFPFG